MAIVRMILDYLFTPPLLHHYKIQQPVPCKRVYWHIVNVMVLQKYYLACRALWLQSIPKQALFSRCKADMILIQAYLIASHKQKDNQDPVSNHLFTPLH